MQSFEKYQSILLYALLLAIFYAGIISQLSVGVIDNASTDDLMRLVQLRDLYLCADWANLVQPRLDPLHPVPMHWSRLVDIFLLSLYAPLVSLVGEAQADRTILYLFPALVYVLLFGVAIALAEALGGRRAGIITFLYLIISSLIVTHIRPGALDHHGLQIAMVALTLLLLWFSFKHGSLWFGICAGISAGISVAINIETQIIIAVIGGLLALAYVYVPTEWKNTGRGFGIGLAISLIFILILTTNSTTIFTIWPDGFSFGQVAIGTFGGIGFAVLTLLPLHSKKQKLIGLCLIAALIGFGVIAFMPEMLTPFAVINDVAQVQWLARVNEAKSFFELLPTRPETALFNYATPIIIIGISGFSLYKAWNTVDALSTKTLFLSGLFVCLTVSTLIGMWQIRGIAQAQFFTAILIGIIASNWSRQEYPDRFKYSVPALLLVVCCNPAVFLYFGQTIAPILRPQTELDARADRVAAAVRCMEASNARALAKFPNGIIMGPIDSGPAILYTSDHSVIAAPYHRAHRGIAASIVLFNATPDKALTQLGEEKADYVLICHDLLEQSLDRLDDRSFAAALMRNESFSQLALMPLPADNPFKLWRVVQN